MKVGTAVIINGGDEDERAVALVEHCHSATQLDLVWWPGSGGVEHTRDKFPDGVPLREPKDYGPEGGGYTWHPVHT